MSEYFKQEREGIIYVCEVSDCQDEEYFRDHKEPHIYFVIDADRESLGPACPVCGSPDNIYEHAKATLVTTEVLNEDD